MTTVRFPDGGARKYSGPVTAAQAVADVAPAVAQTVIGCKIDGRLCDLSSTLAADCTLEFVQPLNEDSTPNPDALTLIRHSAAHLLGEAVQRLIPGTQLVYGPPVATGFYYDVALPEGRSLSTKDFPKLEQMIRDLIGENKPFTRYELSAEVGLEKLQREGSKYKIDNAKRALAANPNTQLSFYATGQPGADWEDLCGGPHVPTTGRVRAVKLLSIAASFWHGDKSSDRLTRVYGTAFPSRELLEDYLRQVEEAKKRDHRTIGEQLRLFRVSELVGSGLVLWRPKGALIRAALETFLREELLRRGYQLVYSPPIGRLDLYRLSGHFPYYRESQYPPLYVHQLGQTADTWLMLLEGGRLDPTQEQAFANLFAALHEPVPGYAPAATRDEKIAALTKWLAGTEAYLVRPMNCPHHIEIYRSELRSYRDLPVRLAEFGTVHRYEQTGELSGMIRVRGFTQDDAHIFVTPSQVEAEVRDCVDLAALVLRTLGLDSYRVRVGLRDPASTKYVGTPEAWADAERTLLQIVNTLGLAYSAAQGEAAFYGPKIDFLVRDCIGREWQLGTVQLDYNLPARFELHYTGPDNRPHTPLMIHRAPFGSMERFVGILIEHFAGAFPCWLAPEQARVLSVTDAAATYGHEVQSRLATAGIRAGADLSPDKIGRKIRDAQLAKVPYMLVLGEAEAKDRRVSVRQRGGRQLASMPLDTFTDTLVEEVQSRALVSRFS